MATCMHHLADMLQKKVLDYFGEGFAFEPFVSRAGSR